MFSVILVISFLVFGASIGLLGKFIVRYLVGVEPGDAGAARSGPDPTMPPTFYTKSDALKP